ncbi:MAG: sigma-70 family RNA polymerase sigma factor [Verrucomicrobiales bacterium]|nr:sigma-70 family RNA polymerase sigma factor [Verrucomicrobiales bacterium]
MLFFRLGKRTQFIENTVYMNEESIRSQNSPTTQWSLIVSAAEDDLAERKKALSEICARYWPPVYAYIRSNGYSPHDAEDLTQGLFEKMLKRNDFAKADPSFGRLRCYLLAAAKNHLKSEHRRQQRKKRGGGAMIFSFDAGNAEGRCLIPEPTDEITPERVFERQWAITVMESVVTRLSRRYAEKGQSELFDAIRPCINTDEDMGPQAEIARRLNMTDQALRVSLHRLRQRYREVLRQTIKETLGKDGDVDDELASLMAAF